MGQSQSEMLVIVSEGKEDKANYGIALKASAQKQQRYFCLHFIDKGSHQEAPVNIS